MPYTVAASFNKFRENIELPGDHRDIARRRRDHIISLLENDFEVIEAFPSGSIPRYTAIQGYSDLDVIVALHYGKHIKGKNPSQVLQAVRDCLGEYKTNVRKNGQAVTLYYKTWPNVDIVPVSQVVDDNDDVTYYKVPDMNREVWMPSRPKAHSRNMSKKNNTCGVAFKRIVKMIKWWNHQHSSLLQSYHIEVMALHAFSGKLKDYSWDVFHFFKEASTLASSSLWHDISYADAYLDSEKRKQVVKRLETAKDKTRDAWYLTYGDNDDHEEAIRIWRQIFGDRFPAYGS
jgi:hypothetical protein